MHSVNKMCTSRFDDIFEMCLSEITEPDPLMDFLDVQPHMLQDNMEDSNE
jgi:hypothetical protein